MGQSGGPRRPDQSAGRLASHDGTRAPRSETRPRGTGRRLSGQAVLDGDCGGVAAGSGAAVDVVERLEAVGADDGARLVVLLVGGELDAREVERDEVAVHRAGQRQIYLERNLVLVEEVIAQDAV